MRAQALSAATDVYALGVILYQLLTGRLPYTRRIGPDTVAEPARLDPELDAVLARALEVDVRQRYATVQTLRADLEHWLKGEPVSAYPDSRAYRWRKFLGRHKLGATLAAMASLAILTSGGVALWQAHEARQAAADMRQWNDFLMDVLRMSSPFEAGDELTLSEALDRAAEQIDARFAGRPDLSAEIRFGIGYSMIDRHRLAQADVQLERALKESIAVFGHDDLRTLRVREAIAGLRLEQSRYADAERGLLEVVAALRQRHQEAVPLYARAANNLGNLYLVTERFAEAERLLEEARRADLAHDSLTPADRAGVLSNLAHAAHGLEELQRADRYYAEAASAYREIFPDGSPDLAIILNNHALLHEERNDPGKALALHRQSLAMRRQVLGAEHPMVVTALTHVARLEISVGKIGEGVMLAQEAARMADRVYTDPDRFHPLVYVTLARAQAASGHADAALAAWRRARELLARLPDPPPSTVRRVEEARSLVCIGERAAREPCSS
jgi:serine/threonine-protein kinase